MRKILADVTGTQTPNPMRNNIHNFLFDLQFRERQEMSRIFWDTFRCPTQEMSSGIFAIKPWIIPFVPASCTYVTLLVCMWIVATPVWYRHNRRRAKLTSHRIANQAVGLVSGDGQLYRCQLLPWIVHSLECSLYRGLPFLARCVRLYGRSTRSRERTRTSRRRRNFKPIHSRCTQIHRLNDSLQYISETRRTINLLQRFAMHPR